jgi:hypothetical protein
MSTREVKEAVAWITTRARVIEIKRTAIADAADYLEQQKGPRAPIPTEHELLRRRLLSLLRGPRMT